MTSLRARLEATEKDLEATRLELSYLKRAVTFEADSLILIVLEATELHLPEIMRVRGVTNRLREAVENPALSV